jgi:hypothetical protein
VRAALRRADVDKEILTILSTASEWTDSPQSPTPAQNEALERLTAGGFLEWSLSGMFPSPSKGNVRIALFATGEHWQSQVSIAAPGLAVESRAYRTTDKGRFAASSTASSPALVTKAVRKALPVPGGVRLNLAGCEPMDLQADGVIVPEWNAANSWGSVPGESLVDTAVRLWVSLSDRTWTPLDDEVAERVYHALTRLVSCGWLEWRLSGTVVNEDTGESRRVAFVVSGFKPQRNAVASAFQAAGFPATTRRTFYQDSSSAVRLTEFGSHARELWSVEPLLDDFPDCHIQCWEALFTAKEVTPPPVAIQKPPVEALPENVEVQQPASRHPFSGLTLHQSRLVDYLYARAGEWVRFDALPAECFRQPRHPGDVRDDNTVQQAIKRLRKLIVSTPHTLETQQRRVRLNLG